MSVWCVLVGTLGWGGVAGSPLSDHWSGLCNVRPNRRQRHSADPSAEKGKESWEGANGKNPRASRFDAGEQNLPANQRPSVPGRLPKARQGLIGREAEAAGQWPGRDPGSWGTPPAAAARLAQGMNLKHDPLSHAHWASPSAQPETPSGQPRVTFNPRSGRFHWPSERRLKPRSSSQVQAHQSHILTRKRAVENLVFARVAQGSPHVRCGCRHGMDEAFATSTHHQSPEIPNATISSVARCGTTYVATRVPVRSVWNVLVRNRNNRRHRFNSGELRRLQNSCSVRSTGNC
jgi:hypothetical protein